MGALMQANQQVAVSGVEQEQDQYLTFMLGGEMFAIPILNIKEIIEYGHLTTVPMMPEFIRGVINLRGSVVPVIDLSARFGRISTEITRRTCIVIIEIESEDELQDIGVVVDTVNEVLEIPARGRAGTLVRRCIRTDFIHGMGKINGKFVIILNVNHVLSIDEMTMLSQIGGTAEA